MIQRISFERCRLGALVHDLYGLTKWYHPPPTNTVFQVYLLVSYCLPFLSVFILQVPGFSDQPPWAPEYRASDTDRPQPYQLRAWGEFPGFALRHLCIICSNIFVLLGWCGCCGKFSQSDGSSQGWNLQVKPLFYSSFFILVIQYLNIRMYILLQESDCLDGYRTSHYVFCVSEVQKSDKFTVITGL